MAVNFLSRLLLLCVILASCASTLEAFKLPFAGGGSEADSGWRPILSWITRGPDGVVPFAVQLSNPWASRPVVVPPVQVNEVQGPAFLSPAIGQTIYNVQGLVSAKTSNSFWLLGPVSDVRLSPGLRVYTTSASVLSSVKPGDFVSLTAQVVEYRSYTERNNLLATQLVLPRDIVVHSSDNAVSPIVLGVDRSPPTEKLSAHDVGPDGWLSVPNNVSSIDRVNMTLLPDEYGLDFWESLEGALVSIPSPVALNFPTRFHEFWIRGNWTASGVNSRGGLSLTIGPDGIPDANPEAILVGQPLDRSRNPEVSVGTQLSDIVGIIDYQHGFFNVLPLTAPHVLHTPDDVVPKAAIVASKDACEVRFGDYNIENFSPRSTHAHLLAEHIATSLQSPDIIFLQEVQDNSGPRDDGTVNANKTLDALARAISRAHGVSYDFVNVDPVDNEDGGKPGGNIRPAFLFNPAKVSLVPGSWPGGPLDATIPLRYHSDGRLRLLFNPGRIDPRNDAWFETRKPIVAQWQTPSGESFFTINHHGKSKRGSSSSHGDARPPVNGGIERRTAQVQVIASFISSILMLRPKASIILAGDFNDYKQARTLFAPLEGIMEDADALAGIPPEERYTYVYDQNSQQLDHVFVSKSIADRGVDLEHIHVNTWAKSIHARASDHDPTVGRVKVC